MSLFLGKSKEEGMSTLTMAMSLLGASVVLGLVVQQSSDMMVSAGRVQVELDEGMSTTVSASAVLKTLLQSGLVFETKDGVIQEDRSQGGISERGSSETTGTACPSGRYPLIDLRVLPTSPAFAPLPSQYQDSDTESGSNGSKREFVGRETEWRFRKPSSSHPFPTVYIYQCSAKSNPEQVICPSDQRVVSKFELKNRRQSSLGPMNSEYDFLISSSMARREIKKRGVVTVRQREIVEDTDFSVYKPYLQVNRRGTSGNPSDIYRNNPQRYNDFDLYLLNPSEYQTAFEDTYSSTLNPYTIRGGNGVPGWFHTHENNFDRNAVRKPAGSPAPGGGMRYVSTIKNGVGSPGIVPLYGSTWNNMQPCNRSQNPNCRANYRIIPHEARVVHCINGKHKSRIIRLTTGDLYTGGQCGSGPSSGLPTGVEGSLCHSFTQVSPLVVSFDNKGIVFNNSKKVAFDFKNGMPATSWISSKVDAGFIVLDKNKNGKVDSIEEMFGDRTVGPDDRHSSDGFAALAKYDTNDDGLIDSQDQIFADLMIWKDKNSNGVTEKGELQSIQSIGLTSISLIQEHLDRYRDEHGNHVSGKSVATSVWGKNYSVYDAWFGH